MTAMALSPRNAMLVSGYLSGWSQASLGQIIGVTGERVRQILMELGITRRSRPVHGREVPLVRSRLRRHILQDRECRARRRVRTQQAVTAITQFVSLNGRPPTYPELYMALRLPHRRQQAIYLLHWVTPGLAGRRRTRYLHAIYARAHTVPYAPGRPGPERSRGNDDGGV